MAAVDRIWVSWASGIVGSIFTVGSTTTGYCRSGARSQARSGVTVTVVSAPRCYTRWVRCSTCRPWQASPAGPRPHRRGKTHVAAYTGAVGGPERRPPSSAVSHCGREPLHLAWPVRNHSQDELVLQEPS